MSGFGPGFSGNGSGKHVDGCHPGLAQYLSALEYGSVGSDYVINQQYRLPPKVLAVHHGESAPDVLAPFSGVLKEALGLGRPNPAERFVQGGAWEGREQGLS